MKLFFLLLLLPFCILSFSFGEFFRHENQTSDGIVNNAFGSGTFENGPMDHFDVNSTFGIEGVDGKRRQKRQARTNVNKWPLREVYFYFDDNINEETKKVVRATQKFIEELSCIVFVESRTATNRIRVYNGEGCSSNLGMIGGEQLLSIHDACLLTGAVAQQFFRALGIDLMQKRSDRDSFIVVYENNIQNGHKGEFAKLKANENKISTPYDYGSIMHLAPNMYAKSKSSITMAPKDIRYLQTIGNRQISFYDIKLLNDFYLCEGSCPILENEIKCKNGGYLNPASCIRCNCPSGYGGIDCTERASGCGEILTATSDWQKAVIEVGNKSTQTERTDFDKCNHWITAPKDKQIQVQITEMYNSQCYYGCDLNGIEIKTEIDVKMTNPLICCDQFKNKIFSSSQNPTPIISFNRQYFSRFTIAFRYVDIPKPVCVDKSPVGCYQWFFSGRGCNDLPLKTVFENCQYTCRQCAPLCKDENAEDCAIFKDQFGCENLPVEMAYKTCVKTCGHCGFETPSCADQNSEWCAGYIQLYGSCAKVPMADTYCKKTCGYCS